LSGVTGGLGSIPKSSTPWAGSSSNSRARASSTPSSASVWAEPTCLTIRCRPPAYSAICTAVAPEAVRTRRMNATPPSLGHRLVRENALTPAHHRGSATCRPRKACPVSQLRLAQHPLQACPGARGERVGPAQQQGAVSPGRIALAAAAPVLLTGQALTNRGHHVVRQLHEVELVHRHRRARQVLTQRLAERGRGVDGHDLHPVAPLLGA